MKKVLNRLTVFILAFAILFFLVFTSFNKPKVVKAEPISIGIGAIAALTAFLGASGISLSAQGFGSNSDFSNKMSEIVNQYQEQNAVQTLESITQTKDALNYYYSDKTGEAIVSMSDSVTGWFNNFRSWFVNTFALTDSGESVIVNSRVLSLPNGKYAYYPNGSITSGVVPISMVPIVTGVTDIPINDTHSVRITIGDPYEYYGTRRNISFNVLINGNLSGSFSHAYGAINGDFSFIKIFFSNYMNGQLTISMAPSDAGDYSVWNYGTPTGVPITTLTQENIGLSGSLTDGYDDFAQALEDARTDAGEKGQVAVGVDVGTGVIDKPVTKEKVGDIIINKVINNTYTGELVGGYANEKEVEEENDVEKVPSASEIGSNIVLVDGLEDFFPFCIPWDIYAFVSKFDAPAEAPNFDIEIAFPGVRRDPVPLHLDLREWDSAARIFRVLMAIGFGLFLVFKTRDLIRG